MKKFTTIFVLFGIVNMVEILCASGLALPLNELQSMQARALARASPRQQRQVMEIFMTMIEKTEWNVIFVKMCKILVNYFLDLAFKELFGTSGRSSTGSSRVPPAFSLTGPRIPLSELQTMPGLNDPSMEPLMAEFRRTRRDVSERAKIFSGTRAISSNDLPSQYDVLRHLLSVTNWMESPQLEQPAEDTLLKVP